MNANQELEVPRPPLPPFDEASAKQKVQGAEDAWNSRDPIKVAKAYSLHSRWRNRSEFIEGREQIEQFLTRKWEKELSYKLKKKLWAYTDNRIAVTFEYEWHDAEGKWFRSYGNELWRFDADGLMEERIASINDVEIDESDRRL